MRSVKIFLLLVYFRLLFHAIFRPLSVDVKTFKVYFWFLCCTLQALPLSFVSHSLLLVTFVFLSSAQLSAAAAAAAADQKPTGSRTWPGT